MSLSDRIDKIKFIINPDPQRDAHVIMVYSHQTKADAIKVYEETKNIKTSAKDRFVFVQILPDDDGKKCDYKQTQFFQNYDKEVNDLFNNKGYSFDKIYEEYCAKGL